MKNEEYKTKESCVTGHRLRITHFGLPERMRSHKDLGIDLEEEIRGLREE
ncbi:hypothetical protein ES705_07311 [subsurface metagenome]